jgi:hypothetical protein
MIVYQLAPIDFWYGWTSYEDALVAARRDHLADGETDKWCPASPAELTATFNRARNLARQLDGGPGESLRNDEGPYLCPLPLDDCGSYSFLLAWKLENNGTTFIASPFALPWLAECPHVEDRAAAPRQHARELGRR